MHLKFLQYVVFTYALLQQRAAVALPSEDQVYTIKEEIASPRGWVQRSRAPPNHKIILRIALPQGNFDELERHLYEVSDPDHARYGQHLSKEEVEELVAPHPESLDAVNNWLASMGFNELDIARSPAGDWITVRASVDMVESMFDTKYYTWKHIESGDHLVRTTGYSVPSHLRDHIELVQPTTMFSRFKADESHVFRTDPIPLDTIIFDDIYNVSKFEPTGKNNSIGITGYLDQFANKEDLKLFYADQRPDATNSSFKFLSVADGRNNQTRSEAGDEANLDVQFAFGLSHPIPGTFFSTAGSAPFVSDVNTPADSNEPYSTWLDFILAHQDPPLTISTSYGDDEQTVPKSYAKRVCEGFAQLGARGISLTFSSGDFGVGDGNEDSASQSCISNDGNNRTMFLPAFPASCPYITSVGGTSQIPEVAVATFFSGGGFSNILSRPSYQDKAVKAFLDKHPKEMYEGLFNRDGRGIPDVAAQADLFKVFVDGHAYLIGGTSAASPTFAGFVAMLNDVRLEARKPPLGFLNPFLYSRGVQGLNDITKGHNGGCGTPGFNATKGWDPVTGLGTPNFGKLKELV